MRWLYNITDSTDMNRSKPQETVEAEEPGILQSMELQRVGHNLATEKQQHRMGRFNILTPKSFHLELTDNHIKNHTVKSVNDLKVLLVESTEYTSKTSTF